MASRSRKLPLEVTHQNLLAAFEAFKRHQLSKRIDQVDGQQAHVIVGEIWPLINEIRLMVKACEEGKLLVASGV